MVIKIIFRLFFSFFGSFQQRYKILLKKRKINKLTATDEVEFMLNQIKNDILSIYDKNMSIEDDTAISQAVIDNDEASRY